jgi:hypothetical protein
VPADFAEIDGAFPTIDVAGNGTGASPWNLTLNDEWAGAVAAKPGIEHGTYTPTLTGMAIGTGGGAVNSASWTFIGGPNLSDIGTMQWEWEMVFGTAGQTFPTQPTIALPAGFNLVNTSDTSFPIGRCLFIDVTASTASRYGTIAAHSASAVRPLINGISASISAMTTTTPFAWAASDEMLGSFTARVVRV